MICESFVKGKKLSLFTCEMPGIKRDGIYALSDGAAYVPHITVKDTVVHPNSWTDCRFEFGYESFTDNAVLYIYFGKPFSHYNYKTAKCHLEISKSTIKFENEEANFALPESGRIVFDIQGSVLSVSCENNLFSAKVNAECINGYTEFFASNGRIGMNAFEVHRRGHSPLTSAEHDKRIMDYRRQKLNEKDVLLDKLEKYIDQNPDALPSKTCNIILPKRLVDVGAEMTVEFESDTANASVCVVHNCFKSDSVTETIPLSFACEGGVFKASVKMRFDIAGNTKIELWSGNTRLIRQVAVLGEGYSAVVPWIGSNTPYVDEILHKYDIPGDYWFSIIGINETPEDYLKICKKYLKNMHLYGDRLAFTLNGKTIIPLSEVGSLFDLDHDTQKRGIEQCLRCMELLKVPVELVASYTPDYFAFEILEKHGVKSLTSLVNWQNCDDGDWIINHCGIPSQPYYPAIDNFRRNGKKRNIMCSVMGNSSYDRNYSIMAFDSCPTNVSPGQRYFENRVVHHQVQRFYDAFDGYLSDCGNSDELTTITIPIEAFSGNSDWNIANELALAYMAKKAATEKIVFTSAADVADYHKEKNLIMQKAYFYQPDYYYGYHNAELPGHIPDRIEAETPDYLAVIARGETLPKYYYDYTTPWENKPDDLPRSKFGVINPDTADHTVSVPPQLIRNDMQITNTLENNKITVKVTSKTAKRNMVTGMFDIPFEKDFEIISDKAVCTKVNDCFTGNTHLFIDLGAVPAGESEYVITIEGTPAVPGSNESVNGLLGAKWFGNHAYLRSTERGTAFYAEIAAPETAYIVGQDGIKITPENGILRFAVNASWNNEAPLLYGYPKSEFDKNLATAKIKNIGETTCNPWSWIDWE